MHSYQGVAKGDVWGSVQPGQCHIVKDCKELLGEAWGRGPAPEFFRMRWRRARRWRGGRRRRRRTLLATLKRRTGEEEEEEWWGGGCPQTPTPVSRPFFVFSGLVLSSSYLALVIGENFSFAHLYIILSVALVAFALAPKATNTTNRHTHKPLQQKR